MPRRTKIILAFVYSWLAVVTLFAVTECGPWQWVCELYGFPTKLHPDSWAFALVVLTLSWPVLVLIVLRGEEVERERAKEMLANAAVVRDNQPSAR